MFVFSQKVLNGYANQSFLRVLKSEVFAAQFALRTEGLGLNEAEIALLLDYISQIANYHKRISDVKNWDSLGPIDVIDGTISERPPRFFNKRMLGADSTEGTLLQALAGEAKPRFKVRAAHQFIDGLAAVANSLMH